MNHRQSSLEELIEAHLAGHSPLVPEDQRSEFERAVAAHAVLREFLSETLVHGDTFAGDRQPPQLPEDYYIERELGRGGMGIVYLVHQKSLGRSVALKVLRPGERSFGPLVKRFLEEARHLARLRHPNIVSIHEVGDAGGEPYFTMDYVDGEPLSALLKRGPLPPSQAVEILKQITAAIQHAHRHGIIHRDLKPSNVLIDSTGRAFVTDFGLARDVSQSAKLTHSGEMLGTPQYMAPEQARGQTWLIGEATDIHGLGLLLFEMLIGRPPFESASPAEVLVKLLNEEVTPPRQLDRRIPRDLETICLKALQKSPSDRYPNVSVLVEDIRRLEAGEPLQARRAGPLAQFTRWFMRRWKTVAVMLATGIVVFAIAAMFLDKSYEELVSWGDEELATGRVEVAAHIYSRALDKATPAQREELAQRIARTCRDMDDARQAVDLAMKVVETAPDLSFGKHDYLVAQALVTRLRATQPTGAIDIWGMLPRDDLNLVRKRLQVALNAGTLQPRERDEATGTLEAVDVALAQEKRWARVSRSHLPVLPTGTTEELRQLANQETESLWNRGKAALALGKRLEAEGQRADALTAYRQAYDSFQRVYPYYRGVKAASGPQLSRAEAPDAEECQLVQETVAAVRRLDEQSLPEPRGVLRFRLEGEPLPAGLGVDLNLVLCDPAIKNPNEGLESFLPRLVPLTNQGLMKVRVLDGVYRLQTAGTHRHWGPGAHRLSQLLQVEVNDWPKQIEVRGGTVDLPPVRLRMASEIKLREPANGVSADLEELELTWDPVPGASYYQVQLSYTKENPSPVTFYFGWPRATEPRLRFRDLKDLDRKQVRSNYVSGCTAGWRVDAYDDQDRRIGQSLEERRFLVVGELGESK